MSAHTFIFAPGTWEGEGTITFSMAEDALNFKMRWTVLPREDEEVFFNQVIEVDSFSEKMRNQFCIFNITETQFGIRLENHLVGKVVGSGLISPTIIAWEFRNPDQELQGFEVYEKQGDGSYKMRAEFTAGEGLRTCVRGYIEKTQN